mmetsp:Transcript_33218/g.71213  ORF Transcript_33218/g.71213 Transcript_33218/m.71213 type:complete len:578 (+) Transcript_33218:72-1805(+)|eukprot:CAMPEP_0206446548 /NCGR_PEP_ID=MMETSP0324_2-20121206/16199_1 /ASSEMBLY_ACC=CAM_ASM_000836 /TAXON_ID=2866 /ORGANISM="Crypthecodinium cohnii, Strain Seligo" /LENGTH=577 /DNA_ID=CAMNT_0053915035 /DNA_START=66 /DNA_END=1799 /DNA_ORIENTATION=+
MSTYTWSYAPTNRATCKGKCKEKIDKGAIRLGVSADDTAIGHPMASFRCLKCVTDIQVKNMIAKCGSLEAVDGYDSLEAVDQELVSALAAGTGGAAKAKAKGKGKAKAKAAAPPPAAPKRAPKAKVKSSQTFAIGAALEEAPEAKPEPSPKKKAKGSGGRPVDNGVPNRDDYTVVDDWSVLLNQTNVVANNNKYYKIQVLKHKDGKYFCWSHWGRVGSGGQNQLQAVGTQAAAESAFKSKFKAKSGVAYENLKTHDWTPVIGKYTYVETEEGGDGEGEEGAPLGKLTPQQIEKGQAVLAKIGDVMGRAGKVDDGKIAAFSSQFYTLIPHDFGFKVPPPINTPEMLEAEEELLKFYLRMGFEEMDQADDGLSPVDGIMELALPPTLETAASKLCALKDIKASTDKGRTHAKKQSGGPSKKMEEHLYAAIMLYTSNAIYRDLNKVLRSEDRTQIKKYFLYLRLLLEALGRLPQQIKTLWRGIGVDLYDQYQVGQTITWWGVSSCTADIKVAKNFMNGCGGKCTLLTVKTKTAADISEITFFGNEKENLLAPGTQLKVVSSKREGKVTEIHLEEVGRALQ